MKNNKLLVLLLLFIAISAKASATVQDSILPKTAKTAWFHSAKYLLLDYGMEPILFRAYPEKDIDKNDTILCTKIMDGSNRIIWNGKYYKWVFECSVPVVSKDTLFKITTYFKLQEPAFITVEKFYNPIPKNADTVGIVDDSWFDSDSLDKISEVNGNGFLPKIYLERNGALIADSIITVWNKKSFYQGEWDRWMIIDARTGKILRNSVTSVSEPETTSTIISTAPNPVSASFAISGVDGFSSVRVVNSLGMEVIHCPVSESKAVIDVSALTSGLYFVQFITTTGMVSKPIIVHH